jgi:hypothetical protein
MCTNVAIFASQMSRRMPGCCPLEPVAIPTLVMGVKEDTGVLVMQFELVIVRI